MSGWSEEDTKLAIELWDLGQSASQIALRLSEPRSRNAVIGRLMRLGKKRSPEARRVSNSLSHFNQANAPKRPRAANNVVRALRGKARAPGLVEVVMIVPTDSRPWTTRRFGECAAPVSGEGAETHSCCAPVDGESVWCAAHRAQFCVPGKKPLNVRALARVA